MKRPSRRRPVASAGARKSYGGRRAGLTTCTGVTGKDESMSTPHEPAPPAADDEQPQPTSDAAAAPPPRPTVDEMGEWSFPASDAPATWTWDPRSG